jgi:hypothetical protein
MSKTPMQCFFQNFEPRLSMVKQLFSNFVQPRKCGESSYLFIAKINLDLDKTPPWVIFKVKHS